MRTVPRLLAITALVLGLIASGSVEARAATTYTPAGGPSVRMVASNFYIRDMPANATFTCNQFDIAGQAIAPGTARAFGNAAVGLGALTYTLCSNPIYGKVEVTTGSQWTFDITGSATGTTWPAQMSDVSVRIKAVGCILEFSGSVPGTFDTSTQRFTPTPTASTMVLTTTTGQLCVTLDFQVGDQMSFGGYFTNVPPSGSTPLSLS